jgi:hypothetical protein
MTALLTGLREGFGKGAGPPKKDERPLARRTLALIHFGNGNHTVEDRHPHDIHGAIRCMRIM